MGKKKTNKTEGRASREQGDLLSSAPPPDGAPSAAPLAAADLPATPPANYTVVARRYRPQQFSDLIGQEATAQALTNALKSNRVAHAYLFTGPRGVGKTSTARILAKAINCVNGPTPNPCDNCDSCKAVATGEDIDVIEIDGASNNRIDEVRELRQNVQYRPSRSRCKIYIIDEVHMVTPQAFNALLKTLEEPPPHVKFIFATTEVQKIPVTILSRCQRFDLTLIGGKKIQERLRQIVEEEKAEADAEALELLARRAGGSMRDAQSLLDQALAFGERRLTVEMVHRLLGTANEDQVADLAGAILEKDVPRALGTIGQAAEAGTQLGELLDQLLDYWRDLLLIKSVGPKFEGLTFPHRFHETLQRQAEAKSLDEILAGLDIWATAKSRLRMTSHGRMVIEMAAVRISRLEDLASLSEIARQLCLNGGQTVGSSQALKKNYTPDRKPLESRRSPEAGRQAASPIVPTATIPVNAANCKEIQQAVLALVPPMLRSALEKAEFVANSGPNSLVFRFPSRYNKDKDYCQQPGSQERLEEALGKVIGQAVEIRFEAAAPMQAAAAETPRVPRAVQMRQAASQDPLVRRAVEELGAQLVKADDGFGTAAVREELPESEEPPDV